MSLRRVVEICIARGASLQDEARRLSESDILEAEKLAAMSREVFAIGRALAKLPQVEATSESTDIHTRKTIVDL